VPKGSLAGIAVLAAIVIPRVDAAKAWPHHDRHMQSAEVRFLATGTLFRSTWSWNEDTYLAELSFAHSEGPFLVRLIDKYPNTVSPLTTATLVGPSAATFFVRHDSECDAPFREMILRAAPGDPAAILPDRLTYWPHLARTPKAGEILPCYRLMRHVRR
jgi:hypothetical protein